MAPSIIVKWRQDEKFYYLESTGIPMHKMMVGITAWQQQVPLPQDFTGENAFRIPMHPVFAEEAGLRERPPFSGAIAVAVNGIPIFNPIKNDGRTDTLLAGELDEYGGHCGRADDYHYHVAPLHLVDVVGIANPIGYGLDGFPLYGLTEPDGSGPAGLDEFNGHKDENGHYHYHATKAYPYVNGGMRGVVEVRDDAITPQPRTMPVRPAGRPLRGAKIIGFTWPEPNRYSLEYVGFRRTPLRQLFRQRRQHLHVRFRRRRGRPSGPRRTAEARVAGRATDGSNNEVDSGPGSGADAFRPNGPYHGASAGHRTDAPFRRRRRFRIYDEPAGLHRECRRYGHRSGDRPHLAADGRR